MRASGVLLSVTSLPSKYGIGCFSKEAYDFVDWLYDAGQTYWQILPIGPTGHGQSADSPYQSYSAFAGNPYLIDLDALVLEGLLTAEDISECDMEGTSGRVDYDKLALYREKLLRKAYDNSSVHEEKDYQDFCALNSWWLDDYALFMALKINFGMVSFTEWPEDIRKHWSFAIDYYNQKLYFDIEFQKFMQYEFKKQWTKLKAYANKKDIKIVGDMPIYVSMDSSDVWAHPEMFQLDEENIPAAISGCPPDSFSATGQIWGNPLYNWDYMRSRGFDWWMSRMWYSFELFDVLRIDHFRGFDEYFSIPSDAKSALEGHWEKGPGMDLFNTMKWNLGERHVIAEDLGFMTEGVRRLVRDSGFPNMKVFEFGFDVNDIGASNDYLPHNYHKNSVAYTGTHDNDTVVGWFTSLTKEEKTLVLNYMGLKTVPKAGINWALIREVMKTNSDTCIIPIQDYLGLDSKSRMNLPATASGNWGYRVEKEQLTKELAAKVKELTARYGRLNWHD